MAGKSAACASSIPHGHKLIPWLPQFQLPLTAWEKHWKDFLSVWAISSSVGNLGDTPGSWAWPGPFLIDPCSNLGLVPTDGKALSLAISLAFK